jgi:hypothetical protein
LNHAVEDNMNPSVKKCPMCAETIPLEAAACGYCGARFSVTVRGYCTACHEIRDADANGNCKVCGTEVADRQVESKFVEEPAPPPTAASISKGAVPSRTEGSQSTVEPRKKSPIGILVGGLGVLVICAGIGGVVLSQDGSLPIISGWLATGTPIPTNTPFPVPTATLRPRPTATFQPDWVTGFSDPTISLVRSRVPDFEDNFSDAEWSQEHWWKDDGVAFEDGLIRITVDGDYAGAGFGGPPVDAVDFVLEFEFTPRETHQELWIGVSFRGQEDQSFNHFTISLGPNSGIPWCGFGKNDPEGKPGIVAECETPRVGWGKTTKEMIIIKGGQAALYLDGQPTLFSNDLWREGGGAWIGITSVSGKSVVEFDNVKFWNLSQ